MHPGFRAGSHRGNERAPHRLDCRDNVLSGVGGRNGPLLCCLREDVYAIVDKGTAHLLVEGKIVMQGDIVSVDRLVIHVVDAER